MTKKILNIIIFILCISILVGCNNLSETDIVDNKTEQNNSITNTEIDVNNDIENDESTDNKHIGGGNVVCGIHNASYHSYPSELISYIGDEKFMEWANESCLVRDDEGCYPNSNILLCIEHFDIPNDVIIEIYKNDYVYSDWDMEALLARDATALEKDAREKAASDEYKTYYEKTQIELSMKYELFNIMKSKTDAKTIKYYNNISDNGTIHPVYEVSIRDMIANTSISIDDLNSALENVTKLDAEPYELPHFEYNFKLLFGTGASVMSANINAIDAAPYESEVMVADSLLRVTDDTVTK